MSTIEDRLLRSFAEFYAMLDLMHFTGASQVEQAQQLKILVSRYPKLARFYLARHDEADSADTKTEPVTDRRGNAVRQEADGERATIILGGVPADRRRTAGAHRRG